MSDDRRYYGLDALRGGMMLLGIVLHSATFYLAAPPPHVPIPTDPHTSLVMDAIFDLIHSFRMPTFFVLAGFFTALLVEKRGVAGAYRNRLARVAAPFAAGVFPILPPSAFFFVGFFVPPCFAALDRGAGLWELRRHSRVSRARGLARWLTPS